MRSWAVFAGGVLVVAAGFGVAALVAARNVFVGFAVLLGLGFAVGAVRRSSWAAPLVGSAVGGLAVAAAYAAVTSRGADLTSGIVFGVFFGVAFVVPGFLFGRALRRSEVTDAQPSATEEEGARPVPSAPSATAYVAAGCLILAIVGALIALFVSSLANMGY